MSLLSRYKCSEGRNYLIQWSLAGDSEDLLFLQNKYFAMTDGPTEKEREKHTTSHSV